MAQPVKSPPRLLASHMGSDSCASCPLPIQSAVDGLGKALEHGSRAWALVAHIDPEKAPASWLQPGMATAVAAVWGVGQWTRFSLSFKYTNTFKKKEKENLRSMRTT